VSPNNINANVRATQELINQRKQVATVLNRLEPGRNSPISPVGPFTPPGISRRPGFPTEAPITDFLRDTSLRLETPPSLTVDNNIFGGPRLSGTLGRDPLSVFNLDREVSRIAREN